LGHPSKICGRPLEYLQETHPISLGHIKYHQQTHKIPPGPISNKSRTPLIYFQDTHQISQGNK